MESTPHRGCKCRTLRYQKACIRFVEPCYFSEGTAIDAQAASALGPLNNERFAPILGTHNTHFVEIHPLKLCRSKEFYLRAGGGRQLAGPFVTFFYLIHSRSNLPTHTAFIVTILALLLSGNDTARRPD